MGVEPTSSAWKAEVIAVIPHLHMVHMMGLEPIREYSHCPLKTACLPIPPHVHMKLRIQSSSNTSRVRIPTAEVSFFWFPCLYLYISWLLSHGAADRTWTGTRSPSSDFRTTLTYDFVSQFELLWSGTCFYHALSGLGSRSMFSTHLQPYGWLSTAFPLNHSPF